MTRRRRALILPSHKGRRRRRDKPAKEPLVIPLAMGLLQVMARSCRPGSTSEAERARNPGADAAKAGRALSLHRPAVGAGAVALAAFLGAGGAQGARARGPLLKFLAVHDTDPFARWEASRAGRDRSAADMVAARQQGKALSLDAELIAPIAATLAGAEADPAFAAEVMTLPERILPLRIRSGDRRCRGDPCRAPIRARRDRAKPRARACRRLPSASSIPAPTAPTAPGSAAALYQERLPRLPRRRQHQAEVARAEARFGAGRRYDGRAGGAARAGRARDRRARARALRLFMSVGGR